MVEDIRVAFKEELEEVPWMDESTKKEALEKADFMNHFIGYPNWFHNESLLEDYYKNVSSIFSKSTIERTRDSLVKLS